MHRSGNTDELVRLAVVRARLHSLVILDSFVHTVLVHGVLSFILGNSNAHSVSLCFERDFSEAYTNPIDWVNIHLHKEKIVVNLDTY